MAGKPTRKSRWHAPVALALAGIVGAGGCRHQMRPGPVCFSPPAQVACPPACDLTLVNSPGNGPAPPAAPSEMPWAERVEPIDLPTALQLANARNPDIALARERINEALAQQSLARLLLVPNAEFSPTFLGHTGLIQRAAGEVIDTQRTSLALQGGPALSLELGDALYAPLAARQITAARRAAAVDATNSQMLNVALAYLDLQQSQSEQRINDDALRNARTLLSIAESYEKVGRGAAADTARARVEVQRRERFRQQINGRIGLASARLTGLLYLPPQIQLMAAEPAVVPVALVSETIPLADLVGQALANHPELAANRAEIEAVLQNWKRAKVAPWLPSLRLSYAGGAFGGGSQGWNAFGGRDDIAATAVWQLQNLGLGNRAIVRERWSQYAQSTMQQASLEARVATEIAAAFSVAFARRKELEPAQREVAAARDSFQLNEERLRRAPDQARPIELLQAQQALTQAYFDYLQVVSDYNRAQFRLYTALGNAAICATENNAVIPTSEPTAPATAKGTDSK